MGNPTEAGIAPLDDSAAPPPPYTEAATVSSSSQGQPPPVYGSHIPIGSPYRPFPPVMRAYYQIKMTRTFHLGESDNHKLFAVEWYSGVTGMGPGKPCTVIYNGPTDKDPILAIANEERPWNLSTPNSIVALATPSGSTAAEKGAIVTEVKHKVVLNDLDVDIFEFSLEVGQLDGKEKGGLRLENFEWRQMRKDELDSEFKNGFRLVRLGSDHSSEVVAVVAWKKTWALNKPFKIEFMGSGLTGELGAQWATMTAITAVRLWGLGIQGRIARSSREAGVAGKEPAL